jgi:diacylglycerol kinase (ATP)
MTSRAVNYRTFVIANPSAGAGAVRDEWRLIERLLRANLPELDYAFTDGPGHATLLAREALRSGWEMIVSIGGDGTLNEVINGFFEAPDPSEVYRLDDEGWVVPRQYTPVPINPDAVLGLIPLGTGGDFRRTIGLMGDLAETVEHLCGLTTRSVDLGQVGFMDHGGRLASRYFINIAAAGISGQVDHHVNGTWKGLGGTASFVWGTTRAFVSWKNVPIEVRLDETTELRGPMQNVVVANGQYFGAGMWIAPGAQLDDGYFQVILMGDMNRRESLRIFPKLYSGKHLSSRDVTRYRARRVATRKIDPDHSFLLDVDGEAPGDLPATWHIHPGLIRLKI